MLCDSDDDALLVRAALSAAPFSAFCEFKNDEPPRRGRLEALCGGDASQRPAPPAFETHYRSLRPHMPVTVEAYGRSAAGVVVEPCHMRTPAALEKSMHFLVHHYMRDPHTPAVFLAPFDVWRHLWDRMRQVRTNWVPQLPQVGADLHSACESDEARRNARESRRRLQWLEFTVAALAVGGANLCRSVQGCRRYMAEKQNFLESMAQCFSDLVLSYRAEQRLRNSEMFSVIILFYGLSQLGKIENRAGFCRVTEITVSSDAEPSHVFEPSSSSVDFGSVYRELAYLPSMARTRHVRIALKLIHSWCQREWFRFFFICRTEPLTVLQRAIVFQSFSYARFRAVLDLVTANVVVYSKVRLRGEMAVAELADLLLMEAEDCVELLDTMGLSGQLSEDRTVLRLSRADSSPLTSQEAIFRHLEHGGRKPQLCLPTHPSFFGFRVWKKAFELFPDAFGSNPEAHADLRKMTCPVNVMELLEPYCPPYNAEVAALELTDGGNEWFSDIQIKRERMLRCAIRIACRFRYSGLDDEGNDDDDDDDAMELENDEDEEDTQVDEQWQAVVQSMDRESKSTRDSVFGDGNSTDAFPTTRCPSDAVGTDVKNRADGDEDDTQHNNNDDQDNNIEDNAVLRSAAALLESLECNSMYAKIRDELLAKQQRAVEERNKKSAHEQALRDRKQEEQEKEKEEEEEEEEVVGTYGSSSTHVHPLRSDTCAPFLAIAPPAVVPVPSVHVTPLPSDYPGAMSPSLTAVVETPRSVTAAPTWAEDDAEEAGEEEKEEEEKKGTTWRRSMPLGSAAAQVVEEGKRGERRGEKVNPEKEEEENVMDGGKLWEKDRDESARTLRRMRTEAVPTSIQPRFPAVPAYLQQQQQQQQQPVPNSKLSEAILNPTPVLTELGRKQQRIDESDSGQLQKRRRGEFVAEPPSPSTCELLLPFEKSIPAQQQRPPVSLPLPLSSSSSKTTGIPAETVGPHGMRRVSFAESVPRGSGVRSVVSYRDAVRAAVKRSVRSPPRVSAGTTRQMELIAKALVAAADQEIAGEPMWMRYFMQYLIRFAACARGLRLADVLRGHAAQDAAWLCRGFSIAPQPLRLASTVVIFGSGLRGGDDFNTGEEETSLRRVAQASFEASSIHISRALLGMEYSHDETADHLVNHDENGIVGDMYDELNSSAIVTPSMRLAAVQRHRSLSFALWVTSLLLSKQEAAALLMRGAVYALDSLGDAGDEQIGLWEQRHVLPSLNREHWCGLAGANGLAQTQVSLHAVDCCDTARLRWAACPTKPTTTTTIAAESLSAESLSAATATADVSAAETGTDAKCAEGSHGLTEHLTAIIALDATKRNEYEAGLETLSLLIRQAAAQQVVHLPGVIVVLHTHNAAEDATCRREIESQFWAQWSDALPTAQKEPLCEVPAASSVPIGRRAYQETIRRAIGKRTAGLSPAHPIPASRRAAPTQTSLSPRPDFFARAADSRVRAAQVTGKVRAKPPSPILVVVPLRTALRSAGGSGADFTSLDMEAARMALTQAAEALVKGYEVKWQEFLRGGNTEIEENTGRESVRIV